MSKRALTDTEIEDICSVLRKNPFISKDVSECIIENLKITLRKQLKNIEVYPQNIPKLKDQILLQFERSQIDPSESVGCIAASSIGADTTQQSLNSFHSAGIGKANLTGGLVRQNELLNASLSNVYVSLIMSDPSFPSNVSKRMAKCGSDLIRSSSRLVHSCAATIANLD